MSTVPIHVSAVEQLPAERYTPTLALPEEITARGSAERNIDSAELGTQVLIAIDTSLGSSVAVGANGRIAEVSSDDPMAHAEVIGGLLQRALVLADVTASAVTGVIAGIGPGPFTGLRVGVAAAHAFALGADAPLHALHSHEAVALALLDTGATAAVRIVQDAKRRELFVTEYSGLDWTGVPVRTRGPEIASRTSWQASVQDVWPERAPAARLVQLAARRRATGAAWEPPVPLYLRQPDVAAPSPLKRVSGP